MTIWEDGEEWAQCIPKKDSGLRCVILNCVIKKKNNALKLPSILEIRSGVISLYLTKCNGFPKVCLSVPSKL